MNKVSKRYFFIMASIVGVLMGMLTGCGIGKQMPKGKLLSMEYTRSGSMSGYQYETRVTTEDNGDVVLRAMKEEYGPLYEKKLTKEEIAGFVKIMEEEGMYKYKERYKPLLKVLDGTSWHFEARFEQGEIYSGGYHAWPNGNGLQRIKDYSISLLDDAQQIVQEREEE